MTHLRRTAPPSPYARIPRGRAWHDMLAAYRAGQPTLGTTSPRKEHPMNPVSHAQNPNVLRRARDLYATYCASSDGKNYQGLPCPAWDALTDAVRGHWYTVALRTLHLGRADSIRTDGMCEASRVRPDDYTLGHLLDPEHALGVWRSYSGTETD